MLRVLAAPAKTMLNFCSIHYGLGLFALLFVLFGFFFSLFFYLRSRCDDPPAYYMFYITLQVYLPVISEILTIFSYICLCITEPQTAFRHPIAGLGVCFLANLPVFLGCELGGFAGMTYYHRDSDPSHDEDENQEKKD